MTRARQRKSRSIIQIQLFPKLVLDRRRGLPGVGVGFGVGSEGIRGFLTCCSRAREVSYKIAKHGNPDHAARRTLSLYAGRAGVGEAADSVGRIANPSCDLPCRGN